MIQNNITKEIISCSFKQLTNEKAIDKISITDIMNQTDYRRQTFYHHFNDKYDLVTWIFSWEVSELIDLISNWEQRENVLLFLLQYLEENKIYYKKIFLNIKLGSFKDYFVYYIKQEVKKITNDYLRTLTVCDITHTSVVATTDFYTYGLSEMLYRWVLEDCNPNANNYHKLLIQAIPYKFQS